jgi:glycerol-3-phosphate responsive antiterminator
MTAFKKDKEGDYTKLLKSSLNDVQESIKCMVELEKVVRSNETLISSYQISMMRMENKVKELKQENKNLIDLF